MPTRVLRSHCGGPFFRILALLLMSLLTGASAAAAPSFVAFESGPVRPIAMSPDRTRLFVANTPNNTLDVFNITASGLVLSARVPVGLEPVAVAALNDTEVWTVNLLSDSVSVVSLTGTPRVTRTLLVGDEPRDIVFAGSPVRAFITSAHRGQHRTDPSIADVPGAGDPQFTTPGIGRADVWVFDPANPGEVLGGKPLKIMNFFSDTPRALAVSPDRSTVYVAAFKSGNQTTTVLEQLVCDGFNPNQPCLVDNLSIMPGGNPGPKTNFEGKQAPETGLIVKYNRSTSHWEDELGRNWNNAVRFKLPDLDVFAVNAGTLTQTTAYPHVGTVLFNMVANPVSGKLYVSNTEANNHRRFEGPGQYGGQTVQGHLAETRVTVISGATVAPRHLNKHIDYSKLASDPAFDPTVKNHSLSMPLDMAVTSNGQTLYVAAFGSSRIGVFNTAELEADTFNPRTASANYISVSGGGPSGLVLDEARGRLYVTTRFDNAVKVIDLASKAEIAAVSLPNPEPASVVKGRPMLYDASRSANGEASCASCHTFGDMDDLAWDLGNPDDKVTTSPHHAQPGQPRRDRAGQVAVRRALARQRQRQGRGVPLDEGAHDHADAAGHAQLGRHALARRPGQRLLRYRRHRQQLVVQELHRRLPGPGGQCHAAQRGGHEQVHQLPTAGATAAQPGAQPGQLAHASAAARAQLLCRLAAVGRHPHPAVRADGGQDRLHLRGLPPA